MYKQTAILLLTSYMIVASCAKQTPANKETHKTPEVAETADNAKVEDVAKVNDSTQPPNAATTNDTPTFTCIIDPDMVGYWRAPIWTALGYDFLEIKDDCTITTYNSLEAERANPSKTPDELILMCGRLEHIADGRAQIVVSDDLKMFGEKLLVYLRKTPPILELYGRDVLQPYIAGKKTDIYVRIDKATFDRKREARAKAAHGVKPWSSAKQ